MSETGSRLPASPGGERVSFTFEGRTVSGVAGEPIAAALHADGVTVLSRSFKYRRPRGLHCMTGSCPNCSMRVDGLPGVVTCEEPLRGGERVEREKGWPSADRDALGVLDRLSKLTPNGFQYRWFRKRPRMFELSEPVLRRLAARAQLPDPEAARRVYGQGPLPPGTDHAKITADVAVIGGGLAGIHAALAAADGGASVVLVERTPALGGAAAHAPDAAGDLAKLTERVNGSQGLTVHTGTTAFGWYQPEVMLVNDRERVRELRASKWIVCTGAYPQPLAFEGNDLPGVMLASAVRRLVFTHGVRPGRRVVVVTDSDSGAELADGLRSRSVDVAAVVDVRPGAAARAIPGVALLPDHTVLATRGRDRVTGVTVAPNGSDAGIELNCDVLCLDLSPRPATELVAQRVADGSITLERRSLGATGPIEVADGVWVAGAVAGATSFEEAGEQGDAVGRAAAS
jgi:sarcosine oxidase subunit alpha